MEFISTSVFGKDIKKLDKNARKLLQDLLDTIEKTPEMGKPMEHHANVFSKRTIRRRLIWQVKKQEDRILLLLYKNRDDAYEALRQMQF